MEIINFSKIIFQPDKDQNVLTENNKFKIRNIEIKAGGQIPECNMENWVIFYVREGNGTIVINGKLSNIIEQDLVFTEPAKVSFEAETKMKILGIIIK